MLRPGGDYSTALLHFISQKTGCTDLERIRNVLDSQKVIFGAGSWLYWSYSLVRAAAGTDFSMPQGMCAKL